MGNEPSAELDHLEQKSNAPLRAPNWTQEEFEHKLEEFLDDMNYNDVLRDQFVKRMPRQQQLAVLQDHFLNVRALSLPSLTSPAQVRGH